MGCPFDGDRSLAPHVSRVSYGFVQEATRIQLEHRRVAAGVHVVAVVHRLSFARPSTGILGGHGGPEHAGSHAAAGARRAIWIDVGHDALQRRALRFAGRLDRGRESSVEVLYMALHWNSDRSLNPDDRTFLAGA